MSRMENFTLIAPSGQVWDWVDYRHVDGFKGPQSVRVEVFTSVCAHCGDSFEVSVRLPAGLRERYLVRKGMCAPNEYPTVRLLLDREVLKHAKNLQLRTCPAHRHSRRRAYA